MPSQVLVVDDSPTIRGFVRLALRGLPVELLEAEDGVQGLAQARGARCVLALIDVQMPVMDGLALVRALRADERPDLRALPVWLLSAERGDAVEAGAVAAGVQGFVKKPLTLATVRDVVARALGGGAA